MDVTTLFKACVKTISLQNKAVGGPVHSKFSSVNSKFKRKQSRHIAKAHTIVCQLTKLHQLLIDNRSAYLNFSNYLSTNDQMTDADRDVIDANAQSIIGTCSQLLKDLKSEIAVTDTSPQNKEHREYMILLIEEFLKKVCKVFSEQKAVRLKRAIEFRNLSKLQPSSKIKVAKIEDTSYFKEKSSTESFGKDKLNQPSPLKIQEINGDVNGVTLDEDEQISPEDIQMFEDENEQLYNDLNSLEEEVKLIESKVVHVAELQELFTEKILEQDKAVDVVMTTVVGNTENVKEANEHIRQAIQRNAGLRVWALLFFLVMSFTLLFLDWYNP